MRAKLYSFKLLQLLNDVHIYLNEGVALGCAVCVAAYKTTPELFETEPKLDMLGCSNEGVEKLHELLEDLAQVEVGKTVDVQDFIRACKKSSIWPTGIKLRPIPTDDDLLDARCIYLQEADFVLPRMTRNVTKMAVSGELDPLWGRDDLIDNVIQVLAQRNKANPILVGAAGVGKTAIIEGLAQRIIADKVPEMLRGCIILELSPAQLFSRGESPGQIAGVLQQIIYECSTIPWLILFIDEIHTIFSNKSSHLDIANILKPALARRDIRLIGATTPTEYANSIEIDHALERRVQRINIGELPYSEVVNLLRFVAPTYERYHQVRLPQELMQDIVTYSSFYLPHHCQPDTVLTFADALMAKARLLDKATVDSDILASVLSRSESPFLAAGVTRNEDQLIAIQKHLSELLPTCKATTESIIKQGKVCSYRKPLATILVRNLNQGLPTVFAEELSQALYKSTEVIYYDMQEFHDPATMNRWLGAPSGYIGFDKGGSLITQLNSHNNPILVLENIEEAHPTIQNIIEGMLTSGYVTDTLGRTAYLTSTVVIGTMKDSEASQKKNTIGFAVTPTGETIPIVETQQKPKNPIAHCFAAEDSWQKDTAETALAYIATKYPGVTKEAAKAIVEKADSNIAALIAQTKELR